MRRIKNLLLISILFSLSCAKSNEDQGNEVHFYGRITLDCNSIGIPNVSVSIHRYYDTGQHQAETVAFGVTDNNGYFSVKEDVMQSGSFERYEMHANAVETALYPEIYGSVISHSNSEEIEFNLQVQSFKLYEFHVKNINPVNNFDKLNYLLVCWNQNLSNDTVIKNLNGTNVDTVIYVNYFYSITNGIFSYTKNNQSFSIDTAIAHSGCNDTLKLNVFY